MASKTDICNLALLRIGISQGLVNVDTDTTRDALSAKLLFDKERDFVLRDYFWPFATRFLSLASPLAPNTTDWLHAYAYPADALFIRRITTANGRLETNPPAFDIGADASGNALIYTDATTGLFEYTYQVTDTTKFDSAFVSLLAWRLGASLALSLSRLPDVAKACLEMYAAELVEAKRLADTEGQKDTPVDSTDAKVQEIVNLALLRLGVTKDSEARNQEQYMAQARFVAIAYLRERDFVLRDFPWPWATAYADPVVFAGGVNTPVLKDWFYAYPVPADALFIRRIVNPLDRTGWRMRQNFPFGGDAMWPVPFRVMAAALGTITIASGNVSNNDTITIGATTYTFKTTLTGAANEVLIGADSGGSALDLYEAINAGANSGVDYGTGTVANASVTAMVAGNVLTVAGLSGTSAAWSKVSTQTTLRPTTALQSGRFILTNEGTITIEYTRKLASDAEFDTYDRTFASMLAWRLAADLAPSRVEAKRIDTAQKNCLAMYELEKTKAQASALREGQPLEPLDAEWLRSR